MSLSCCGHDRTKLSGLKREGGGGEVLINEKDDKTCGHVCQEKEK